MAVLITPLGGTVRVTEAKWTASIVQLPVTNVEARSGAPSSAETYKGSYVVIPTAEGLTMSTRSKRMESDVDVRPIPYYETSNESGGMTVSIAS